MSGISGYGYSRGNYAQVLRAQKSNRGEHGRNEKSDNDLKDPKVSEGKGNSGKSGTERVQVFEENFDTANGGRAGYNVQKLENFKTTSNNDVFESKSGKGTYVEIDGTDSQAGRLKLSKDVTLEAGTYEISFEVTGNQERDQKDKLQVKVGDGTLVDKTVDVDYKTSGQTVTATFTVDKATKLDLEFVKTGGNDINRGVGVDNVKVSQLSDKKTGGSVDSEQLASLEKKLADVEKGLSSVKGSVDGNTRATTANGDKIDRLAKEFSSVGDALKEVASKVSGVDAKADANGKKLDDLNSKFGALSEELASPLNGSGNKEEIEALAKHTKEVATRVDKALGNSEENGRKIDSLGSKFDIFASDSDRQIKVLSDKIDDATVAIGKRLDVTDANVNQRFKDVNAKIDQSNREDAARDKALDDRFDQTDKKIDDLGKSVDNRFDNVDEKLNGIADKLGNEVTNVSVDLSKAVTELKEVIKEVGSSNDSKLTDTVKDLKKDFNKQFDDLKSQHEAQTNALLEKLDEVTMALKTLSEQSNEQIAVLKDKLGGLGGQLGTVINKIDMLGQGQAMSHRSLGLFTAAAKVGDGALEKLIGLVGTGNTGNQLRSAQSRLQSVSARFGGGQTTDGLNLLA